MRKSWQAAKGNLRQTSHRQKRIRLILIIGAIALLLLSLLPSVIGWVASVLFAPIFSFQNWMINSSSDFPRYFQDRSTLVAEIRELEQQLASMGVTAHSVRRLQVDNTELRTILNASSTPRIAAQVTSRPTALPYDAVLINRGRDAGVKVGAPVYQGVDQVIGVVDTVFANAAIVTLITSPGLTSTVYVIGPDIYTVAEGQGGGVLRVRVPQGVPLDAGDLLILPVLSGGVIGEVSFTAAAPTQPERFGYVNLPSPISSLRWVSVGTEPLAPIGFPLARENVNDTMAAYLTVPVPEGVLIESASSTTSIINIATSTATSAIEN